MSKAKSSSAARRHRLFELIEETGFEVMPCSHCSQKHLRCKMLEGVSRCSECVRRGRACDGSGVSVSSGACLWVLLPLPCLTFFSASRLIAEKRRLEVEEEKAEEELIALQQQVNERLSRLMRLRRQKKQIHERGAEMVRRGLNSLDELEESDRHEAEVVVAAQSFGAVDVIDWTSVLGFDTVPSFVAGEMPSEGVAHQ